MSSSRTALGGASFGGLARCPRHVLRLGLVRMILDRHQHRLGIAGGRLAFARNVVTARRSGGSASRQAHDHVQVVGGIRDSWARAIAGLTPMRVGSEAAMDTVNILLCWESNETHSWNPILAELLRAEGMRVTEIHDLHALRSLDLAKFDVCLPRFRVGAAHMAGVDEALVASGIPMINSRDARRRCENKELAHLAFEEHGIAQPPSFAMNCEGFCDRALEWDGETVVKPLYGNRGNGIEICGSLDEALARARGREEDVLLQQMIWPARCWRIAVGRAAGVIDPYWRRPPTESDRVLSISTGSTIVRDGYSDALGELAVAMLEAVDGDLLAVDVLETPDQAYALEINHNFDAHGADGPAAEAFRLEIARTLGAPVADAVGGIYA
jgi:glutathione synthase/RimK-type ligase-like ATP-grasp enzyme